MFSLVLSTVVSSAVHVIVTWWWLELYQITSLPTGSPLDFESSARGELERVKRDAGEGGGGRRRKLAPVLPRALLSKITRRRAWGEPVGRRRDHRYTALLLTPPDSRRRRSSCISIWSLMRSLSHRLILWTCRRSFHWSRPRTAFVLLECAQARWWIRGKSKPRGGTPIYQPYR